MEAAGVERLARLEGAYEQIDRRLGSIDERLGRLEIKVDERLGGLEAKVDERFGRLETKVDANVLELRREISNVNARLYTLLYGIVAAVLMPIIIRVFLP